MLKLDLTEFLAVLGETDSFLKMHDVAGGHPESLRQLITLVDRIDEFRIAPDKLAELRTLGRIFYSKRRGRSPSEADWEHEAMLQRLFSIRTAGAMLAEQSKGSVDCGAANE